MNRLFIRASSGALIVRDQQGYAKSVSGVKMSLDGNLELC